SKQTGEAKKDRNAYVDEKEDNFEPRKTKVNWRRNWKRQEKISEDSRHQVFKCRFVRAHKTTDVWVDRAFEKRSAADKACKQYCKKPGIAVLEPQSQYKNSNDQEEQRVQIHGSHG